MKMLKLWTFVLLSSGLVIANNPTNIDLSTLDAQPTKEQVYEAEQDDISTIVAIEETPPLPAKSVKSQSKVSTKQKDESKKPAKAKSEQEQIAAEIIANPQKYIDRPGVRPQVEALKETLQLGSDEEVIEMVKSIKPELIKKVAALDIELSPAQANKLEELTQKHKDVLVASVLLGTIPDEFINEASEIVPELNKLTKEEKKEVFKAASKTVNKLIIKKMLMVEPKLGYMLGSTNSGLVAGINARLANIRAIKIGNIIVEDVHMKLQLGYPTNGLVLINGKVSIPKSKWSFQGSLLGLSHDIRKQALDFNIASVRANYELMPWLHAYTQLDLLGIRSYDDGNFFSLADPKVGVVAKKQVGKVQLQAFAEGGFKVAEQNPTLSCGASASLEVMNEDFMSVNAGIMTQVDLEGNPREHGNGASWTNGVGINGQF